MLWEKRKMLILAVNPGSTSTRTALYENERCVDSAKLEYAGDFLDLPLFPDQYLARGRGVLDHLERVGVEPHQLDGFAARGGRLKPLPSGVYRVNEKMVEDAKRGLQGQHPANIAVVMAWDFEKKFGVPAYTVDPISVDELDERARITGIKGIRRVSFVSRSLDEIVAKKSAREIGMEYAEGAYCDAPRRRRIHKRPSTRRMVDSTIATRMAPFAVERAGGLPTLNCWNTSRGGAFHT